MKPQTITAPSDQIREAFARWLAGLDQVRLVVLEGITKSGKTTIVDQPFVASDGSLSKNIGVDDFLPPSGTVSPEARFLDVLDHTRLLAAVKAALKSSHLVIVEGAIVRPVIESVVDALGSQSVRRVYLKRMSRTMSDYWACISECLSRTCSPLWRPDGYRQNSSIHSIASSPLVRRGLIFFIGIVLLACRVPRLMRAEFLRHMPRRNATGRLHAGGSRWMRSAVRA